MIKVRSDDVLSFDGYVWTEATLPLPLLLLLLLLLLLSSCGVVVYKHLKALKLAGKKMKELGKSPKRKRANWKSDGKKVKMNQRLNDDDDGDSDDDGDDDNVLFLNNVNVRKVG